MSSHFAEWDRRTLDLALEEVTRGLAPVERAELSARTGAEEIDALEMAIADLTLAAIGPLEVPPAALMQRIAFDARRHFRNAP